MKKIIRIGIIIIITLVCSIYSNKISAEAGDDVWIIQTGGESTIQAILENEGYLVSIKTTDEIITGIPDDIELLVYPGGLLPITQAQDGNLRIAIKDYIANGGNFFGSCGGSIPGATSLTYDYGVLEMIGLVQVTAEDYISWFSNVDYQAGFVFSSNEELNSDYANNNQWLLYTGGPAFSVISGQEANVEILAAYAADFNSSQTAHYQVAGKAAIVKANYGEGKVLLSAPHPESDSNTQFLFINYISWLTSEDALIDYTPALVTNIKIPNKFLKSTQAKIKWDLVENADSYAIKLMNNKKEKIKIYKINKSLNYKVIKKLKADKKYKIKVRAKRTVGDVVYKGLWSKIVTFNTKP